MLHFAVDSSNPVLPSDLPEPISYAKTDVPAVPRRDAACCVSTRRHSIQSIDLVTAFFQLP